MTSEKAIDLLDNLVGMVTDNHGADYDGAIRVAIEALKAQDSTDEWCTDCKEYDAEKHCCPRFNKVIRTALQDSTQTNAESTQTNAESTQSGKDINVHTKIPVNLEITKIKKHQSDFSDLHDACTEVARDTISRQAAIDAVKTYWKQQLDALDEGDGFDTFVDACDAILKHNVGILNAIEQLPSAEPKGLSCDGCKFCGQLDTEFPCNSCVRREKDYYAGFNQQTGCD